MGTDLRQSAGWAAYLKSQGWEVEELKVKGSKCKVYIRRIPLIGSVVKIQRPAEIPPVKEIDRLAKKHHALLVKIEPLPAANYSLLTTNHFEPDPTPNLPTKTLVIDLAKSEDGLWKELSQDARQSVRKAQDSYKLQVASCRWGEPGFEEALSQFHQLLKETGRRQKFWTPRLDQLRKKAETFGKDATLFLVRNQSQTPVAGSFILNSDGTHSASSPEGRRLYAPYLLLWETIRHLKKTGRFAEHDLAGIYDPRFHRATKKWQGFTTFKKKFGGREVDYPLPQVKYYSKIIRALYQIYNVH